MMESAELEEGEIREGDKRAERALWERWAREYGKRWPEEKKGLEKVNAEGVAGGFVLETRGKAKIPFWYRKYAVRLWVGVGM